MTRLVSYTAVEQAAKVFYEDILDNGEGSFSKLETTDPNAYDVLLENYEDVLLSVIDIIYEDIAKDLCSGLGEYHGTLVYKSLNILKQGVPCDTSKAEDLDKVKTSWLEFCTERLGLSLEEAYIELDKSMDMIISFVVDLVFVLNFGKRMLAENIYLIC